jgi:hypothetical protein
MDPKLKPWFGEPLGGNLRTRVSDVEKWAGGLEMGNQPKIGMFLS